jgi:esterase
MNARTCKARRRAAPSGTPQSLFLDGSPRLHYLEWNPAAPRTLVLLHGGCANAWWWAPLARAIGRRLRLVAPDQRGHGESEWVRPPAYHPRDYARDLRRLIRHAAPAKPVLVGHSLGGLNALAFAQHYPNEARAVIAIDVGLSSGPGDRPPKRPKTFPTIRYPDLETAKARFRLIPDEGKVAPALLSDIAERSASRTPDGRYSFKFDRESFFSADGFDAPAAVRAAREPLLLVRAEHSRIMSQDAAERAGASNPLARLAVVADSHHHIPLERPAELARVIEEFVAQLDWRLS